MAQPTRALAPAEAPTTLLDALARAPAAAALVVGALRKADRKALRLAHPQLCDAVGEATNRLEALFEVDDAPARPPTPRRWPRLEELNILCPDSAGLEALGSGTWGRLRLVQVRRICTSSAFDAHRARALAAALRRMPALRALELRDVVLSDNAAAALFCASSAEAAPQMRALTVASSEITPAAARLLAASGWRLEELDLLGNFTLGAAGLAPLLAAPTFALRRLDLAICGLDASALLCIAGAPGPLEELDLSGNDFSAAAAAPALAALSRRVRLRCLAVDDCFKAAGFKALVEASWPALTSLRAQAAEAAFDGPHALGSAAFAGFPALEELKLTGVKLGEAGARVLASRRWARLRCLHLDHTALGAAGVAALARGEWPALEELDLSWVEFREAGAAMLASRCWPRLERLVLVGANLGDAGLAALARGAWPALARLNLRYNNLCAQLALEDARRWAPALVELVLY